MTIQERVNSWYAAASRPHPTAGKYRHLVQTMIPFMLEKALVVVSVRVIQTRFRFPVDNVEFVVTYKRDNV
jgi:hypothetical protein